MRFHPCWADARYLNANRSCHTLVMSCLMLYYKYYPPYKVWCPFNDLLNCLSLTTSSLYAARCSSLTTGKSPKWSAVTWTGRTAPSWWTARSCSHMESRWTWSADWCTGLTPTWTTLRWWITRARTGTRSSRAYWWAVALGLMGVFSHVSPATKCFYRKCLRIAHGGNLQWSSVTENILVL